MSRGPLLIAGASGRAAAASAIRAGFEPEVIDLFADADTRRLCRVTRCPLADYPDGLVRLADQARSGPWMYTGGLENHPDVVAAISANRELLGNGPDVLRVVRNPFRLHDLLSMKAVAHPWLNAPGLELPKDKDWLRKPVRGAGGSGIRFAGADDWRAAAEGDSSFYLQEFVNGLSGSVVCRTDGPSFTILGTTTQLVGLSWLHARPFAYCGSVARDPDRLTWAGGCFLHAFHLRTRANMRGVWGFDFIWSAGEPFLVEVNPRYTASVEVLELHTGSSALAAERVWRPMRLVGKAVYYAPSLLTFPASGPWDESLARCTDVWKRPDFADIPEPGTEVEAGQPVLTILAESDTEDGCVGTLRERAAELDHFFGFSMPRDVK